MCLLPPFASSIRRWIVLSKIQLFIEVPSGLCSYTYQWGTVSGRKELCSWILFTYLVVPFTSNQTTSQNKKNLCWSITSLHLDLSCHDWFLVTGVTRSHRNSTWSAVVPRKISLHFPHLLIWALAGSFLSHCALPTYCCFVTPIDLSWNLFPEQEKNRICFCLRGTHDVFLNTKYNWHETHETGRIFLCFNAELRLH